MRPIIAILAVFLPRAALAATIPNPLGSENLEDILKNVTQAILNLAIPVAAGMYIWAGFNLLTAGGNSSKISKAKDIFKWTTIGLVIVFIGGGFVDLIRSILDLGN